jgi:hypothetical protein
MGRSVVPRPSRLTTEIGDDDAVADADARPPARTIAPVVDLVSTRRPMPAARGPEPSQPVLETAEPPQQVLETAEPPLRAQEESAGPPDVGWPLGLVGPPKSPGRPDASRRGSHRNQGRFAR